MNEDINHDKIIDYIKEFNRITAKYYVWTLLQLTGICLLLLFTAQQNYTVAIALFLLFFPTWEDIFNLRRKILNLPHEIEQS